MEVRTLIKRGTDHHVYCEDDLYHFNIGNTYIGAVFDGCSTGVKSHFASSLFAKILKKYEKNAGDIQDLSLNEIAEDLKEFFGYHLRFFRKTLKLDVLELLSTMVCVIIRDNNAYIMVSGDGCILIDEKEIRVESPENAPDYLAYHMDYPSEINTSIKTYEATFKSNLCICSDGIYSFTKDKEEETNLVIDVLLKDTTLLKSDAMLARKYNLLTKEGITNYDDLSIIRFML